MRPTLSGTRSTTSRPQFRIIATFFGLLVISRTRREAERAQDVGADAEVALVVLEAEAVVGLDGVEALVLQRVGAHLVGEPDAAALLVQVEQDARPLGRDLLERGMELRAAVALEAAEEVAGEAGGMQAAEHRLAPVRGADLDRVVLLAAVARAEDLDAAGLGDVRAAPAPPAVSIIARRRASSRNVAEAEEGQAVARRLDASAAAARAARPAPPAAGGPACRARSRRGGASAAPSRRVT